MKYDDESLIKNLKKRNQDALKFIIDMYIDSVHGVAYSILGNIASSEDIEECVQDVFVDVWNNINKYDSQRGSLKTWILMQCKYKALNIRKSLISKNNLVQSEDIQILSKEDIEQDYLIKESKEEILGIIYSLNKIDREVFIRRYLLDQRIEEVCIIMNLTRQAVDNRLWRGKKIIRETLNMTERWSSNE